MKEDYYRRYHREAYEEVMKAKQEKSNLGERKSLLEGKKKSDSASNDMRSPSASVRQSNGFGKGGGQAYMMVPE